MGDMLIRGIPEALKRDIRSAADKAGQSLSEKAIDLLQKGVAADLDGAAVDNRNPWEQIRSIFVSVGAVGDEYSEIFDEIERERKRDFGRPLPDLE